MQQRKKMLDIAYDLLRSNQCIKAREAFLQIDSSLKDIEVLVGVARCYISARQYQEAIELLLPQINCPDSTNRQRLKRDILISLARCYRSLDDPDPKLSESYLQKIPDQKDVTAQFAWAMHHYENSKLDKSVEICKSIEKRIPNHFNTHFLHAFLLNSQDAYQPAIAKMQSWIDRNKKLTNRRHKRQLAKAHAFISITYLNLGDTVQALHYAKLAKQNDPKYRGAWTALGKYYQAKDDFPEAEKCFNEAMRLDPAHFDKKHGIKPLEVNNISFMEFLGEEAFDEIEEAKPVKSAKPNNDAWTQEKASLDFKDVPEHWDSDSEVEEQKQANGFDILNDEEGIVNSTEDIVEQVEVAKAMAQEKMEGMLEEVGKALQEAARAKEKEQKQQAQQQRQEEKTHIRQAKKQQAKSEKDAKQDREEMSVYADAVDKLDAILGPELPTLPMLEEEETEAKLTPLEIQTEPMQSKVELRPTNVLSEQNSLVRVRNAMLDCATDVATRLVAGLLDCSSTLFNCRSRQHQRVSANQTLEKREQWQKCRN